MLLLFNFNFCRLKESITERGEVIMAVTDATDHFAISYRTVFPVQGLSNHTIIFGVFTTIQAAEAGCFPPGSDALALKSQRYPQDALIKSWL